MDTYQDTNNKTKNGESPRRGLRIAVAVFVAVLLVGAAAVLLQQESQDDAVAAGAPLKVYDGTSCTYSGATEFDLNSFVTFTFINESDDTGVGFVVWEVPDGTTAEEVDAKGIGAVVGTELPQNTSDYEFFAAQFPQTLRNTEYQVTVPLDRTGLYSVNCYVETGAPINTHHATIITVGG